MNIPGTQQPLKVYERTGPPVLRNDAEARQRRGLLAKIHIAKKDMGLNEGEYDMILRSFKVASSGDMTIPQLENMVELLKHYGWKPVRIRRKHNPDHRARLDALRKRVLEEAQELPNWENRLAGLVKSTCGVTALNWVGSAAKLERLLKIISQLNRMATHPVEEQT